MDQRFRIHDHALHACLAMHDTTTFFALWSCCVESSLFQARGVEPAAWAKHRDKRGFPEIRTVLPKWAKVIDAHIDTQSKHGGEHDLPLHGITLKVLRTATHLCTLMAIHKPLTDQQWHPELVMQWSALVRRISSLGSHAPSIPQVVPHKSSWTRTALALKLFAAGLKETVARQAGKHRAERRAALASEIQSDKTGARAYSLLRDPPPKRLAFLERGGVISVDPEVVDDIAVEAWSGVYAGNHADNERWSKAWEFMAKHSDAMHTAPPFELPPLTPAELKAAFAAVKASAPGPDQWTDQALAQMSDLAAAWLCRLFHAVEAGDEWPQQVEVARSVFLAKCAVDSVSPFDYRVLTIASVVYRRWAAVRLAQLQPWVNSWATEDLYGGIKGRSADSASWLLALDVELGMATDTPVSAMATDIYKCFDQMSRQVILLVAARAGAPPALLRAWCSFLDRLTVHNCLAATIGRGYSRGASIPQGCPLSMVWLSLVLRPLVINIRAMGCIPRALADDLMAYSVARDHWRRLKAAGEYTHQFLEDAGSRVAPKKSQLFSSVRNTRITMKGCVWRRLGQTIPVTTTARDLGSQANFGLAFRGTVLGKRILDTMAVVAKVQALPGTHKQKLLWLVTKCLPKALFGCESTPVQRTYLRPLTAALKRAFVSGMSSVAAPALAFASAGRRTPDPSIYILKKEGEAIPSSVARERPG